MVQECHLAMINPKLTPIYLFTIRLTYDLSALILVCIKYWKKMAEDLCNYNNVGKLLGYLLSVLDFRFSTNTLGQYTCI